MFRAALVSASAKSKHCVAVSSRWIDVVLPCARSSELSSYSISARTETPDALVTVHAFRCFAMTVRLFSVRDGKASLFSESSLTEKGALRRGPRNGITRLD